MAGAPQLIYSRTYNPTVVTIQEFVEIFNKLAKAKRDRGQWTYCIFMLDLLLLLRTSTEWLPVLDIPNPLYLSIQRNNIAMLSMLSAYGYSDQGETEEAEFKKSVMECIVHQKYRMAMIMCEQLGVPVVVRVDRIRQYSQLLQKFGISSASEVAMNVTVSMMNVAEGRTRQIDNIGGDQCVFDEYMLFILGFEDV